VRTSWPGPVWTATIRRCCYDPSLATTSSCLCHSRRPLLRGQPQGFMKKVRDKSPRLRLDANSYRELYRQVLERDGWRCQFCSCMQHLQVQHLKLRSHSGCDEEQNLITLCAECHEQAHRNDGCCKARLQ
jgi:hypothetical protein